VTTFVLIHGAYQGGWIWQPTAVRLRGAGHLVYAVKSPQNAWKYEAAEAAAIIGPASILFRAIEGDPEAVIRALRLRKTR
jgi:hypothetical protein